MVATNTRTLVRKKAAAKRRSRLADQARQDILNAAALTFAERGYREARVQDIAVRAGYTAGALYTYFKSKKELFDALGESVAGEVTSVLREETPMNADFPARLEAFVSASFAMLERHRHAVVYFMQLDAEGGPRPRARVRDVDFVTAIGEWLEANAKDDEFPGFSRSESATFIWATLVGVIRVWAVNGTQESPKDLAPAVVRFLTYGLQGRPPKGRRMR